MALSFLQKRICKVKMETDFIEKQEVLQVGVNKILETVKLDKEDWNNITGRVTVLEAEPLDANEHRKQYKECLQDLSSWMKRVEVEEE